MATGYKKTYVSVNGVSKPIRKMYASVLTSRKTESVTSEHDASNIVESIARYPDQKVFVWNYYSFIPNGIGWYSDTSNILRACMDIANFSHDVAVDIEMSVYISTEANFDIFSITTYDSNANVIGTPYSLSGILGTRLLTFSMEPGSSARLDYQKDDSVDGGEDIIRINYINASYDVTPSQMSRLVKKLYIGDSDGKAKLIYQHQS